LKINTVYFTISIVLFFFKQFAVENKIVSDKQVKKSLKKKTQEIISSNPVITNGE
jgi:hypothetical protein